MLMVAQKPQEQTPGKCRAVFRRIVRCEVFARLPYILFGLILYAMDVFTIGSKVYSSEISGCSLDLAGISCFLFVLGTAVSQVVFYTMSSFNLALLASSISETFIETQSLSLGLWKTQVSDAEFLSTTLVCFGLSTLFTAAGFFLLYYFGAEKALSRVPKDLMRSLFLTVGIFCCIFANDTVLAGSPDNMANVLFFNAACMALWGCCKYAVLKKPGLAKHVYILAFFLALAAFYLLVAIGKVSIGESRAAGVLPRTAFGMSVKSLVSHLGLRDVKYSFVLKSIPRLLNMALFNIVHFPINVQAIQKITGAPCDVRQELLANGAANIACSVFSTLPSYLVSSSTVSLNTPSRGKRKDGLVIGLLLFGLSFVMGRVVFYVPYLCFDMLLFFIGLDIFLGSVHGILARGSFSLVMSLIVSGVAVKQKSLQRGIGAGAAAYALRFLYRKWRAVGEKDAAGFVSVTLPMKKDPSA